MGLRFLQVIPYGIQFFMFYISGDSVLQKLYSRIVKNRIFFNTLGLGIREDTQIDFFTQSVFWTLRGWGVLQLDALTKSVKNRFLTKQIFDI